MILFLFLLIICSIPVIKMLWPEIKNDGLICQILFITLVEFTLSFCIFFAAYVSSAMALEVAENTCPMEESQWSFEINALKDNLVTEGHLRGSRFSVRGYVDGELSYFYSRNMRHGEIIEHIPADMTYIRYDNNVHPKVEVHQKKIDTPEWMSKVFFIDFLNQKTNDYYVIVVPEGTISNSGTYQIDME